MDVSSSADESITELRKREQISSELTPENMWTPELEKLMRVWRKQICKRQKGHIQLSLRYSRTYYILGIPTVVLTTITSSAIIATFQDNCSTDSGSQWIRLGVGMIGLCATTLSAIQTFMSYQSESERHKSASDAAESLVRTIDSMLEISPHLREDPVIVIQHLRKRYDDIVKNYPQLPEMYSIDLSYPSPPASENASADVSFDIDSALPLGFINGDKRVIKILQI